MTDYRYSFEDWQTGKITAAYLNDEIDGVHSSKPGRLPADLFHKDLLSRSDYYNIIKEREKAFHTAVKITVNTLIERFKNKLSSVVESERLLEIKIEELEESIEKASKSQLRKVFSEDADIEGIDWFKYMLILHPGSLIREEIISERPEIIHLSNPSTIIDGGRESRSLEYLNKMIGFAAHSIFPEEAKEKGLPKFDLNKYVRNELYDLTVNWNFLKRLKELNESPVEKHQGGYGTHQENRDWILEEFEKQEKIQPSQNQTVIKVKELYKEEFGLRIGKTTILRIVGRAD